MIVNGQDRIIKTYLGGLKNMEKEKI